MPFDVPQERLLFTVHFASKFKIFLRGHTMHAVQTRSLRKVGRRFTVKMYRQVPAIASTHYLQMTQKLGKWEKSRPTV